MLLVICQLNCDVNLVPRSLTDEANQEIWVQDYLDIFVLKTRNVIGAFRSVYCHRQSFIVRQIAVCPVILS